jgi:NAD+-dependent protein deacetylase SIR2
LPYAEAVFEISYFRNNPLPFYMLAHELYPGKYKPTISHLFLRLLSDKGLLLKLFTQNIDCLEREAGVPENKIVEAHGSFAHQRCIECKTAYPENMMKEAIHNRNVPHCLMPLCNGIIKPDIVFFGEQLPMEFHLNRTLPSAADLCIIMGTSLTVQPFASLPGFCAEGVPRLLINLERVGSLGSRADDVVLLKDCDTGVRMFAAAMGWAEELEALWAETDTTPIQKYPAPVGQSFKDDFLDYQIAELTREVERSLKVTAEHDTLLRKHLAEKHPKSSEEEKSTDDPKIVIAQSDEDAAVVSTSSLQIGEVRESSTASHPDPFQVKLEESFNEIPSATRRKASDESLCSSSLLSL